MDLKKIFFWQPRNDFLKLFSSLFFGNYILIFLNYIIWVFFIFISFLLVKKNINIFWQLLVASIISEVVERIIKKKVNWSRPLYLRKDKTPSGLIDRWYKTGSFPSGHTIKTCYFLLFILQYQVFDPIIFILVVIPLLFFRVLIGFHYPVDMFGGVLIGILTWFLSKWIILPYFINNIIKIIFNSVFFIK